MVQNDKLPFAALHGDPDILEDGKTRFGPTALALLVLERYKGGKSIFQCLKTLNLDGSIIKIFWDLLKDSEIRNYVFKNFLFEVPGINKGLFVKDARKIVPSLTVDDIEYAKGFGGVRPQVLNKTEKKLMLGEASLSEGNGIIFNMTPSPGATSCLGNAQRDVKVICEYLNLEFDEAAFLSDLTDPEIA
jgi:malate dehydrogenase (quinone)